MFVNPYLYFDSLFPTGEQSLLPADASGQLPMPEDTAAQHVMAQEQGDDHGC